MVQRRWSPPTRYGLWILPPRPPLWWWKGAYLLTCLLAYPGPPLPPIPFGGPSSRITGPCVYLANPQAIIFARRVVRQKNRPTSEIPPEAPKSARRPFR